MEITRRTPGPEPAPHRSGRPPASRERGASLVEFALVATLLVTILFGIAEFGFAFRDWLTVTSASRSAARVGSAAGQDPAADMLILDAVAAGMSSADVDAVREVWVFKARQDGSVAGGGTTNRYTRTASFCGWSPCPDPTSGGFAYGGSWPPGDRNVAVSPGSDLDLLGVRIIFDHEWLTGFIGDGTATWTDDAVMRMEPQQFLP